MTYRSPTNVVYLVFPSGIVCVCVCVNLHYVYQQPMFVSKRTRHYCSRHTPRFYKYTAQMTPTEPSGLNLNRTFTLDTWIAVILVVC